MNRLARPASILALAVALSGTTACSSDDDETGDQTAEPTCTKYPAGSLCVRGTPSSAGPDMLIEGDKLRIQVTPGGCFSSSCTSVDIATCAVRGSGTAFTAMSEFCLTELHDGTPCTEDCGGGGSAECEASATLSAGTHSVTLDALTVTFTVPGFLDPVASCASTN
jgi:hypothetical protein